MTRLQRGITTWQATLLPVVTLASLIHETFARQRTRRKKRDLRLGVCSSYSLGCGGSCVSLVDRFGAYRVRYSADYVVDIYVVDIYAAGGAIRHCGYRVD